MLLLVVRVGIERWNIKFLAENFMSRCPDKFFVTTKNLAEGDKCNHVPTHRAGKLGRIMKLPDNLIYKYFEVYTSITESELYEMDNLVKSNPFEAKKLLATEIVKRYHGNEIAEEERLWFDQTFSLRKIPTDIPVIKFEKTEMSAMDILINFFGNSKSKSELRRLFSQNAVSCNDLKITNPNQLICISDDDVFQVGKRVWFKIKF